MDKDANLSLLAPNNKVSYELINTNGVDEIFKPIPQVLNKLRDDSRASGIVATRFDVLAHSMGGLATWTYVSDLEHAPEANGPEILRPAPFPTGRIVRDEQSRFRNSTNYGAGTIKRIVTIGTPYAGSSVADQVLAFMTRDRDTLVPVIQRKFWDFAWQSFGNGNRAAYVDFSEASRERPSAAISLLRSRPSTNVPIHTMAGIAGTLSPCTEQILNAAYLFEVKVEPAPAPSDKIVPAESQRGGLPEGSSKTTNITNVLGVCHTQETSSPELRSRLPMLINNPAPNDSFHMDGLPVSASQSP
jgi:triacylglycerol esterase/lipase EstA (alpha/beta hydrolase family)